MAFRISVAGLAVLVTCVTVFLEFLLMYNGGFDVRGQVWDAAYETLSPLPGNGDTIDALLTVLVYTLPETLLAMALYHAGILAGRAMGLDEAAHARGQT